MRIANFVTSRMTNKIIRVRTRASALTDCLRHDWTTVVKLCDMGNIKYIRLRSLL
jgi:hypothetical protein